MTRIPPLVWRVVLGSLWEEPPGKGWGGALSSPLPPTLLSSTPFLPYSPPPLPIWCGLELPLLPGFSAAGSRAQVPLLVSFPLEKGFYPLPGSGADKGLERERGSSALGRFSRSGPPPPLLDTRGTPLPPSPHSQFLGASTPYSSYSS